ncbi:hypothetical protein B0H14DRAFT_3882863 [Mycena olivaceomarginata]|nr:hypothetical protein B0H14DRAFT_3882863 [Mycena olivaceomarginata]
MDTLYAPRSVYIKECDPEFPRLLSTERIVYSCLGPHPRILECLNENIYSLPVETRYEVAKSEPLRFTIAPNGDLMRYLLAHPHVSPPQLRAKWGLQIAEGIAFVHSHQIVWGDCSTANMLLTADLDILLCDFGGSALYGGRTNVLPPLRYCDPHHPVRRQPLQREQSRHIRLWLRFPLEILTYNPDVTMTSELELHRGGNVCTSSLMYGLLIDDVFFSPFKAIVENCWDGKYADGQQLFAAVCDAYVQFETAISKHRL